jgi:hypothetical protein
MEVTILLQSGGFWLLTPQAFSQRCVKQKQEQQQMRQDQKTGHTSGNVERLLLPGNARWTS